MPRGISFRFWFRDWVHHRGLWRTLKHFTGESYYLLLDYLPSRRRLRYGDIYYDFDHNVDTTSSNVPLRTRIHEIFAGRQYQPSDPVAFHESVSELGIRYEDFTFIDLGSGKGRALLMACEYPFRHIVGVELLPELHVIAERNVEKFSSPAQRCRDFECVCADARDYVFPPEPLILYSFNPFPEHVLADVLRNVERSLREYPRQVFILYHSLTDETPFHFAASFKRLRSTDQYVVFGNSAAVSGTT
jgi:SAM-dependent methyltransferase